MAGKSLSDKFIPYALRSKSIERGYYNKNKDFAEVMGLAVINALKSSNAVEMSKFGEMTTALESGLGVQLLRNLGCVWRRLLRRSC